MFNLLRDYTYLCLTLRQFHSGSGASLNLKKILFRIEMDTVGEKRNEIGEFAEVVLRSAWIFDSRVGRRFYREPPLAVQMSRKDG